MEAKKVKVYEVGWSKDRIRKFTASLNNLDWRFTRHGLDRLFERYSDKIQLVLDQIKHLELKPEDAFEYCLNEDGKIEKACYSLKIDELEEVHFSVTYEKELVSAWPVFVTYDEHGRKRMYLTK